MYHTRNSIQIIKRVFCFLKYYDTLPEIKGFRVKDYKFHSPLNDKSNMSHTAFTYGFQTIDFLG